MKTIGIRISDDEKQKIENTIKRTYPEHKTVSDVIRTALNQYLENSAS